MYGAPVEVHTIVAKEKRSDILILRYLRCFYCHGNHELLSCARLLPNFTINKLKISLCSLGKFFEDKIVF